MISRRRNAPVIKERGIQSVYCCREILSLGSKKRFFAFSTKQLADYFIFLQAATGSIVVPQDYGMSFIFRSNLWWILRRYGQA